MRSFRMSGRWGLLLILAALVLLPFALLLGLVMLVLGLLGGVVSLLLGGNPKPVLEPKRRSPLQVSPHEGKVLDAEYEVKDEP